MPPPYHYRAYCRRVVDGDTMKLCVIQYDYGFGEEKTKKITLRLEGIDTPETFRPSCQAELLHGEKAKERVRGLIEHQDVWIHTVKYKTRHGEKTTVGHRYRAHLWFDPFSELIVQPENGEPFTFDFDKHGVTLYDGTRGVDLVWLLKIEGLEKRKNYQD